jgi:hypothetical protein
MRRVLNCTYTLARLPLFYAAAIYSADSLPVEREFSNMVHDTNRHFQFASAIVLVSLVVMSLAPQHSVRAQGAVQINASNGGAPTKNDHDLLVRRR